MDKKFIYTDEELIGRFQNGDEQAYIALVNRYKDKLINFVYRLVNDRDQAEDIIQDTMLKLYTHKHYYRNIAKFSTWLFSLANNVGITEMRKQSRWFKRNERAIDHNTQDEADSSDIDLGELDKLIIRLPEQTRQVFVLHALQDYSHQQIADLLHIAEGTSKSQFFRAKKMMQEWL